MTLPPSCSLFNSLCQRFLCLADGKTCIQMMPTACCACIFSTPRLEDFSRPPVDVPAPEQRALHIIQAQPQPLVACTVTGPSSVLELTPVEHPSCDELPAVSSTNCRSPVRLYSDNASVCSSGSETRCVVKICTEVTQTTEFTDINDGDKR